MSTVTIDILVHHAREPAARRRQRDVAVERELGVTGLGRHPHACGAAGVAVTGVDEQARAPEQFFGALVDPRRQTSTSS